MSPVIAIPAAPRARADFTHPIRRALRQFGAWHERARMRRALREMDDRMLADIGLTRSEADTEARKPFWCG